MYTRELINLDESVRNTIEDFQQTLSKHKITVSGSFKNHFYGDINRLSQVIINLLSNAVKYSPQSEKIHVTLKETAKTFQICVIDYGVGISQSSVKKVFERFYRDENIENSSVPGLGIGLYISQQIANAHGGEIQVKSSKNKGSEFTLVLPKKPAEPLVLLKNT
jgi:signal transduction histidine kinase